jgi:hypothetical protein
VRGLVVHDEGYVGVVNHRGWRWGLITAATQSKRRLIVLSFLAM